jgi:acetyl esterase
MLDPQVKQYLDEMAALGAPPVDAVSPEQARVAARARRVLQVQDTDVPGPAGAIPLRAYTPPAPKPLPALVFFHGGGWVIGDLDTTDTVCRVLAEWAGCIVVSVNYRHAPEHRFPAAIDDAYAATVWIAENAASLQADAGRIGVGGFSAGGNLAAAVALQAKAQGHPALIYQWLVYPVIDAGFDTPSMKENGSGFGLTTQSMSYYWDQYAPNPADRLDPLASPLRAPDLAGLPPAFVMTAEYDPLRDEGEAYAARLRDAGVPTLLKRYEGMIHGFLNNTAEFEQARLALSEAANELKKAFATVPALASEAT